MATSIQESINKYQNSLKSSPTANTPNVKPSSSDVSTQKTLMATQATADKAKSDALKTAWYGNTGADDNAKEAVGQGRGALGNLLHNIGTPLYAVAGAVEAALGKGTKKGLANIKANVDEEGTFGDILRSYNVPNIVAMPLGLALDVFADPLSWITLGTGSTIGRIAVGAGKGAGLLGAKSAALQRLESLGRVVPGLGKRAFSEEASVASSKLPTLYRNISKASAEASDAYRTAISRPMSQVITEEINKVPFWGKAEKLVDKMPGGKTINKILKYDTQVNQDEALANIINENDRFFNDKNSIWSNIKPSKIKTAKQAVDDSAFVAFNPKADVAKSGKQVFETLNKMHIEEKRVRTIYQENLDRMVRLMTNSTSNADRRALMAINGMDEPTLKKFSSVFDNYRSNLDGYDKVIARALTSKVGRETLGTYAKYIGLFKVAKIGGNILTATTNMTVGNLVMMMMHGIDISNADLMKEINMARKALYGKDIHALNTIFGSREMLQLMRESPSDFRAVLGVNPNFFTEHNEEIRDMMVNWMRDVANKAGKGEYSAKEISDVQAIIDSQVEDITTKVAKKVQQTPREATSTLLNRSAQGNTSISQEILTGPFSDMVNRVKKYGDETGSNFAKAFHWYLTKPMDFYSKGDQVFRVGMMNHLLKNGITETELQQLIKRGMKINPEDIVRMPGRNMYQIMPRSSLNISKEMFMNYMAMPGFVRIMRTLPLVGSPFFSFIYGMSAMTAKTAAYNPAVFNKVQFGLREFGGEKSPLEKVALESPYYQWYNKDGMVKLPFFKENPVYANMQNMLPYYTMNIFQPMERTYKERFGANVAAVLDKLPFLKSPEGQILFDYLIQPNILQQSEPQGAFGQQLYPTGATNLQKAGYAAQAAVETLMPPTLGYLGLAFPNDPDIISKLPLYRWRQMAFAKQGKTSIGAQATEDPTSRTARTAAAIAGFPYYKINLDYVKNTKQ